MRHRGRYRLVVLGAAGAMLALLPNAAFATSATVGVATGSGTISPALTTTPQAVSGGFTGTLTAAGTIGTTPVVISDTCTFTFASSGGGDDIATGQGTSSGSCSGSAVVSASLNYLRVGAAVVITGSGSVNGVAVSFEIVCEFEATSAPNVSSFDLECEVIIDP